MSKKNGSSKGDMMKVASFMAFIAMVLAIILLIVAAIVPQIAGILNLIKDIALLAALAIPAYYFTKGKPKWVKIVYWIVLVCFLVAAIFGNGLIK